MNNFFPSPLINAVEKHGRHPDTFIIPTTVEIDALNRGDCVKIGTSFKLYSRVNGERFCVRLSHTGPNFKGVIEEAGMIFSELHGYAHGDVVSFGSENIMAILPSSHSTTT